MKVLWYRGIGHGFFGQKGPIMEGIKIIFAIQQSHMKLILVPPQWRCVPTHMLGLLEHPVLRPVQA